MMATEPTCSLQEGLHLGGKFGEQGENTPTAPRATLARTIAFADGYTSVCPKDMYRFNEQSLGRREPGFSGIHNLHETVISRTLSPPRIEGNKPKRRAMLWDIAAKAVREALLGVPAGSHVNVCANRYVPSPSIIMFGEVDALPI